jgi:serine protease Do
VRFVYDSLRKYGHVHRIEIQAGAQEITPSLAEGLGLARDWGVIISDVAPKGPGAVAGLQAGDIVSSVDNRRISGLAAFAEALYLHTPNQALRLDVLRDRQKMSLTIPAMQPYVKAQELADFVDPQNLVDRLGIFVHDLDDNICSALPVVRIASGVVVVAQSAELNSYISSLRAGDILHSLNRQPIESVDQLRSMLQGIKTGQAVALQIEREGRLEYVAFDWGN